MQPCEIDAGDQHSSLLKPNVQCRQITQTPDKKQRAHQQHNGKRHLGNDEDASKAKPLPASGRSPAARLQQGGRLRARGADSRGESEGDGCEEGKPGGERQHAPVHAKVQENLILLRADEGHKHPAYRERQKQSANRACGREQKAFGK